MSGNVWKIGFIVIAVIALAVSVYMTFSGPDVLSQKDSMTFVDLRDGTLYRVPLKGRSLPVPMRSPEDMTKQTLFPVEERDGAYFLTERYYSPEGVDGISEDVVVGGSLEVRVANRSPQRLDLDEYRRALETLN